MMESPALKFSRQRTPWGSKTLRRECGDSSTQRSCSNQIHRAAYAPSLIPAFALMIALRRSEARRSRYEYAKTKAGRATLLPEGEGDFFGMRGDIATFECTYIYPLPLRGGEGKGEGEESRI